MASKQRADKQKEKEKKEKIILVVLAGVLLVVGAIEVPTLLKGNKKTASGSTTPALTSTIGTGAISTGAAATNVSTVAGSLPNQNAFKAGSGQLSEFSLFNSRDPFGNVATSGSTTPSSPTTTTPNKTSTSSTTGTVQLGDFTAASISINGGTETVLLKAAFPVASPAFVLESVSAKQIKISVNGGSFASGQGKVTIGKGKKVVLVNTVDSIRYSIKFVAPLRDADIAAATTSVTTTGMTAATTSTTTSSATTATTS